MMERTILHDLDTVMRGLSDDPNVEKPSGGQFAASGTLLVANLSPMGLEGQGIRVSRLSAAIRTGPKSLRARDEMEQLARLGRALADAARGKGNFGIGSATRSESEMMGKAWVGGGYRKASNGRILISRDGLRQYRQPSAKSSPHATTDVQSNFEQRPVPKGEWQSNGHLNITD